MLSTCVQVSAEGLQSIPLNLAVSWRCENTSTDLRIDYKYNGEAMTTPMALNNVQFLVPVDGGVSKLQAVLPPAAWYRHDLSYKSTHIDVLLLYKDCLVSATFFSVGWFGFDFQLVLTSFINVFICPVVILTGMQSSKESFGRFLISHRSLKMEVSAVC